MGYPAIKQDRDDVIDRYRKRKKESFVYIHGHARYSGIPVKVLEIQSSQHEIISVTISSIYESESTHHHQLKP
jgi:hypothetical protein